MVAEGAVWEGFTAKEKLEIVQSERVASASGWKGAPAESLVGGLGSDIFKQTPPTKEEIAKVFADHDVRVVGEPLIAAIVKTSHKL